MAADRTNIRVIIISFVNDDERTWPWLLKMEGMKKGSLVPTYGFMGFLFEHEK